MADGLKREWNDREAIEAKYDLQLLPTREHIRKGNPKDPCNCVLALCAKDTLGSSYAKILLTKAYIAITNPKTGKEQLNRFLIVDRSAQVVAKYDMTHIWIFGEFIVLKAPHKAAQLETARLRRREGRHDTGNGGRRIKRRIKMVVNPSVRYGSGTSTFSSKRDED